MPDGTPKHSNQTATMWGHNLRAVEGQFHSLIWECVDCEKIRTRKHYFIGEVCDGK